MSLALHAHHLLIIATLAFAVGALLPFWYTSPDSLTKRNIFQICVYNNSRCIWTLPLRTNNLSFQTVFPILVASLAIACVGTSLIGLILGSWYVQRFAGDIGSKWLLVLTIFSVLLSFLFSCGVWAIMLTTNLHQNDTNIKTVRLEDLGFSFWINIGASGAYFYVFFIYLIAICKSA